MDINKIAENIDHVVVMMMENRSFDHLFGYYKGVVDTHWGLPSPGNPQPYNWGHDQNKHKKQYPVWQIDLATQVSINPDHQFSGMLQDIFGHPSSTVRAEISQNSNLWRYINQ